MRKIVVVILVLIFSFSFCSTLTLKDYLIQLKKNDPGYKKLYSASEVLEGQILAASSTYGWKLSGDITKSFAGVMTSGASSVTDVDALSARVAGTKILEETGTAVSVGYNYETTKLTVPSVGNVEAYKPAYSISISQPLMKNFLGSVYRYPLETLQIVRETTKLQTKENVENYFEAQMALFYDWVLLTKSLEATGKNYENILKQHNLVEKQYKNDFVNKSDLLRSKELLRQLEDVVNSQLIQWNTLLNTICKRTGISCDLAKKWDELPLIPIDYNLESAIDSEKELRIFKVYDNMRQSLELEQRLINENSKMQVDAFANYSLYESKSSSTGLIGSPDKSDYALGLKASVDLEQIDYRGKQQEVTKKIEQLDLEKEQIQNDIDIRKAQLEFSLSQNEASIARTKQIVRWTRERLAIETKRYNSGKVQLFNLVDTNNEYLKNENNYLANKVNRYKLIVQKLSLYDGLYDYLENIFTNK